MDRIPSLSLCIVTKNEENHLEQCLNSVKNIVDEIIIVDTGSTDRTKEIAKKFGAKIYDFKWIDDFSAARNESLKHATKKTTDFR
ncbi:glycosyltransferase [Candidatus Woesearchaeota archaeon]|nr:glycosyltransferase [Candidatus Woesearchaeota archaeon]